MELRRTLAMLSVVVATVLSAACATDLWIDPQQTARAQQPLPGFDAAAPIDPESARATLALVAERRALLELEWAQREYACKRSFLVNPCLGSLRRERLAVEQQLTRIELAAQQTLRNHSALERNRREAERLSREEAVRETELQQREASRRVWDARQQAAREDAEQRARDEAQRARSSGVQAERRPQRAAEPAPASRRSGERPVLPLPGR